MSFTRLYLRQRLKQRFLNLLFVLRNRGQVQPSVYIENPHLITLKPEAKIGQWVKLYPIFPATISIGKDAHIGTDVIMYTFSANEAPASIIIGDGVLVGAKSVILKGCRIGDGCIVGAGSVMLENTVTGTNELWAGVPAKMVKKIRSTD